MKRFVFLWGLEQFWVHRKLTRGNILRNQICSNSHRKTITEKKANCFDEKVSKTRLQGNQYFHSISGFFFSTHIIRFHRVTVFGYTSHNEWCKLLICWKKMSVHFYYQTNFKISFWPKYIKLLDIFYYIYTQYIPFSYILATHYIF